MPCCTQISDGVYVVGPPENPVFLLDTDMPFVIDGGFSFLTSVYLDAIKHILGNRPLHCCFLTHSHFDHCGSVAYFKQQYPELTAFASGVAQKVFNKPSAISLMKKLTRAAADITHHYFGITVEQIETYPFIPFTIDQAIHDDGIEICAGSEVTVRGIPTPGHTRDCISYYIPEKKLLFSSEALGIADPTGYIFSEFLIDYDMYLESAKRLQELDVDILCIGHNYVYKGESAKQYIIDSIRHCVEFYELVSSCLTKENFDIQRVMKRIKAIEYDGKSSPQQPEPAYLLNLDAKITVVKKRML
ncbi:MAG: MBL fold metallo-hydrolase [Desulfobacterales bacterium]|nr:MBL fold metallo-hydrolase [Desulfobacterales bacterium]